MTFRGIFHFHSCYSFDCLTSITSIADVIEKNNLDFAVLTDHDRIEGCFALRDELKKRNLKVEVPVAAEYRTDIGDIIVVGVEKYLNVHSAQELLKEAKELGGVTILPHPYDGHNLSAEVIRKIDLIEAFNGRSTALNDKKSRSLAQKYGKKLIFSSDAHIKRNLDNVIIKYSAQHTFVDNCLRGVFELDKCQKSDASDLLYSQLVKSIKQRNPKIAISIIVGSLLRFLRDKCPKLYRVAQNTRNLLR